MNYLKIFNIILILGLVSSLGAFEMKLDTEKELDLSFYSFKDYLSKRLSNLVESLKEDPQIGRLRKQRINNGCIWKVCSRPLKTKYQNENQTTPQYLDLAEQQKHIDIIYKQIQMSRIYGWIFDRIYWITLIKYLKK